MADSVSPPPEVPPAFANALRDDEDEFNDARAAIAEGFPREAWPAYSAWVRSGDRGARSVWPLVKAAFAAGVAAGRTQAAADLRRTRDEQDSRLWFELGETALTKVADWLDPPKVAEGSDG